MTKKIKNKDLKMDLRVKHEDDRVEQSGRSMVEMLGTLAIIGVLSVGGIAGYTYGMNKYYANELLAGASARAVIVASQLASGQNISLSEFDKMKDTAGGTFDGTVKEFDDGIGIKVSGVKKAVCENLIKDTEGTDIGIETEAGGEVTCGDENEFYITFANMGGGNSNKCLQEDYAKENICECMPSSCDCETYAKANPGECCRTVDDFYGKKECCEISRKAVWVDGYGCCMAGETESQACCEGINGSGSILAGSTCCPAGSDQGDCCYITGGGMYWTGSYCCQPGDETTNESCCKGMSGTHWDAGKGICCYDDAWLEDVQRCYE